MSDKENIEHTEQKEEQQPEEKKKKKKWLLLLLLLLLLILGGVGGFFVWKNMQPKSQFELDRNALEGFLPGKSKRDIEKELNRIIEKGRFNVSMNPTPIVKDKKINVAIENVPANNYYMQVEVYIYPDKEDTDKTELIYKSGMIKQGYYIEEGDLQKGVSVKAGTYDGIAIFHAFNPETTEEIGSTAMTLQVTAE